MTRIATLAQLDSISVAPHNPSGPISTAATAQVCAGMSNFRLIELQWGEIGWRRELLAPQERFDQGFLSVSDRPGFGIRLNDKLAKSHPI
jgi:galactonate dehydratase